MVGENEIAHERWMNDSEYRKQVIRELEQKYHIPMTGQEFHNLVD